MFILTISEKKSKKRDKDFLKETCQYYKKSQIIKKQELN